MKQVDTTTHIIEMAANICTANSAVRFPCFFYVTWKTNDQKASVDTDKYLVSSGKAEINQIIKMKIEMSYDHSKGIYLKKQTHLQLNLLSKNKPDPSKMVGRVSIDLANILNQNSYKIPTEIPLEFCSVSAVLLVCFEVLNDKQDKKVEKERHPRGSFKLNFNDSNLVNEVSSPKSQANDSISHLLRGQSTLSNNNSNKLSDMLHLKKEDLSQREIKGFKAPPSQKQIISIIQNLQKQKPILRAQSPPKINLPPSVSSLQNNNSSQRQQYELKMKENEDSHKLELQATYKTFQNIKIDLEHKLEQKQYSSKQMSASIETLQGEVAHFREEANKKINENVTLTLNLAETKQNYNRIIVQLSTAERQVKRLEGVVEQFKAVEGAKGELNSKLAQTKSQLIQLISKHSKLESQNQQLKAKINNLNAEKHDNINIFQSKLKQMKESLAEMAKQNNILKNQHKKKESTIENLFKLKSELEENVATLNSLAEEHQLKKSESEIYAENIQQKMAEQVKRTGQLEDTLIHLDLAQKNLEAENQRLAKLCDEYSDLLLEKEKENDLATQKIQQSSDQFNSEKSKLNSTIAELNTKINKLNNQLGKLNSKIIQLQQQLWKTNQKISNKEKMIIQLDQSLNTVVNQNNNLQQNVQKLMSMKEQELNNTQAEIKEYQIKVNQLEELLITNSEDNTNQIKKQIKQIADRDNIIYNKEIELEKFQLLLKQCSQELTNRQSLINRLQEGLNGQISRNEELNKCIMSHLHKQENLKENILVLQKHMSDIKQLLERQEQLDSQKKLVLKEKEMQIQSLSDQLNQHKIIILQYKNTLKESKIQFDAFQGNREEQALERDNQLRDIQNQLRQRQAQLNEKQNIIIKLNEKINRYYLPEIQAQKQAIQTAYMQMNSIYSQNHQKQLQFENNLKALQQKLQVLIDEIQEVNRQGEQKQLKISNLEDNLEQKQMQVLRKEQQLLNKEEELLNIKQELLQSQYNLTSIQQEHLIAIKESQQKYLLIEESYQEMQKELEHKDNMHHDEIQKIEVELLEIKDQYQQLCQEKQTFDMKEERNIQKQLQQEISCLKDNILTLEKENAKIQNLQRTLKIKSIQLNSFKFKGKIEGFDQNSASQLLRLKDQQIAELRFQIENLSLKQQKLSQLQQKVQALYVQLQLLEQEKFNIEAVSNERHLALVEVKQENRKLMDEITIIGDRNGQLQKMMVELLSKDKSGQGVKSTANDLLRSLVKQNDNLKKQLHELDSTCKQLHEDLQNKDQRHMVDIIDQQLKLSQQKSNTELRRSFQLNSCLQLPNGQNIYGQLKKILSERSSEGFDRILQIVELSLSQPPKFQQFYVEIKNLSKQISKIKVQILKSGDKIGERQKYLQSFKQVQGFIEKLSLFPSQ